MRNFNPKLKIERGVFQKDLVSSIELHFFVDALMSAKFLGEFSCANCNWQVMAISVVGSCREAQFISSTLPKLKLQALSSPLRPCMSVDCFFAFSTWNPVLL